MECSNAQVLAWINLDDIVLNELGDLMKMIQDQELRQTFNNIILNYKIYVNWMLFIIRFINSSFMHYFKLQKLEFK